MTSGYTTMLSTVLCYTMSSESCDFRFLSFLHIRSVSHDESANVFVQLQESLLETLFASGDLKAITKWKILLCLKYKKSRIAGTVYSVKVAQLRLRPRKGQAGHC